MQLCTAGSGICACRCTDIDRLYVHGGSERSMHNALTKHGVRVPVVFAFYVGVVVWKNLQRMPNVHQQSNIIMIYCNAHTFPCTAAINYGLNVP